MKLREPIFEAQIIKLAEALQNPASVHGRRNHDGDLPDNVVQMMWEYFEFTA